MAYSNACTRCAQLAFASITATAVSMSVVAAPPVRSQLPIEHYLVQLQATTVSAIKNSATFAADALVGDDLPGVQTASPAAATGDPAAIIATIGRGIASAIGPIVAPVWWLAAPITVPLWSVLSSTVFPNYPKSFGIPFFAMFPSWLGVPLDLANLLFPLPSTDAKTSPSGASSAANVANATSGFAELTKSSTADAIATERRIPAAAATAEDNFWDSPLGTTLIAINVLLLPIWFLAAPITLPLSMLAAVSQIPEDDSIGTLKFLVLTAVGFLTGPIGVFDIFTRQNPTPAAAVKSSATRSLDQAEDLPQETADETSLATDSGADIDQTATGGNLTSSKAVAPLGDPRPKQANAIKPAASVSGGGGVESSNAAAEVDDTALPRSSAERASRSSVQAQSRKARVDSSTD